MEIEKYCTSLVGLLSKKHQPATDKFSLLTLVRVEQTVNSQF